METKSLTGNSKQMYMYEYHVLNLIVSVIDTCFPGVCPSVSLALVIVNFVLFCMGVSVCVFVGVCSLCVSIFVVFCFAVCITLWQLGETLKKSSLRANMQSTFVILLNVYFYNSHKSVYTHHHNIRRGIL